MPRALIGKILEIQYQSPNDLVSHLTANPDGLEISWGAEPSPAVGEARDVVIRIPWLGRELRLSGRVARVEPTAQGAVVQVTLSDGPHDTLAHLREFVGRIRSGAILEEIHDRSAEGAAGLSAEQRIRAMTPTLRALLAAKANSEERLVLSRDPDPRVIEFLLKNPSLSIEEIRRLSARLNLHQGHFTIIARNPIWMNDESVRATLARNPRLPEFMAGQVLTPMSTAFLKELVESVNTTSATRRVAGRILQTRGIAAGTRRPH